MFIVVKESQIINCFRESETTIEKIQEIYPDCQTITKQMGIIASSATNLLRVYGSDVVLKPRVEIVVDKDTIIADGEEEVNIFVSIKGLQEDEIVNEIILEIDGVAAPVSLYNGSGSISIASKVAGMHLIDIASPKDVIYLKGGFVSE